MSKKKHRVHIPTARKQGMMTTDERGLYYGFSRDSEIVYIGRRYTTGVYNLPDSPWKNSYSVKRYGREKAVELYREHILTSPELHARHDANDCVDASCERRVRIEAFIEE
jgi:hypothetical protein